MSRDISIRPTCPPDAEFLYDLYASTREEELAVVLWNSAEKAEFLRMQFDAQNKYYHEQFRGCDFLVVQVNGEAAGRLYIDRRKNEIRIVDIALMPKFRGRGTGTTLLKQVLAEGSQSRLPVRIHVEQNNRALRLYKRLGFKVISETGVYFLLEWTPQEKQVYAEHDR